MNTGSIITGRPSMGSWVLYGLGSEAENLPGIRGAGIVRQGRPDAADRRAPMVLGISSQPLPGRQVQLRRRPRPSHHQPPGLSEKVQRDSIEAINALNRVENQTVQDPEILTRIAQYELAFRMQSSVPDLVDVSKEPAPILDMYGAKPGDGSFASNCLLARKLAERGVRFIQVYHRDWDHHSGLKANVAIKAEEVDRATAALIQDLKAARHAR